MAPLPSAARKRSPGDTLSILSTINGLQIVSKNGSNDGDNNNTATVNINDSQQQRQQQQHNNNNVLATATNLSSSNYNFDNDYVLVDRLKSGSFGTVYTTYHKSSSSTSNRSNSNSNNKRSSATTSAAATTSRPSSSSSSSSAAAAAATATTTTPKAATDDLLVVKIIDRTKLKTIKDHDNVLREVCILNELKQKKAKATSTTITSSSSASSASSNNIIELIDFYITSTTFYVVQVYAKGGDVFDKLSELKQYTEKDARDLAIVLLNVLQYIHFKGICHRDLKPENLLLKDKNTDSKIYVADFGFATYIPKFTNENTTEEGYLYTRCGTPAYVAPEIVLGRPYQTSIDMWSAGCIIYQILCGYPPFQAPSLMGLYRKIRAADYSFHSSSSTSNGGDHQTQSHHHWTNVSVHAKRLISQLLTVDPTFRLSATQSLKTSSWLQIDEANLSRRDLSISLGEIKKQVYAKRKLKSAMKAVLFMKHKNNKGLFLSGDNNSNSKPEFKYNEYAIGLEPDEEVHDTFTTTTTTTTTTSGPGGTAGATSTTTNTTTKNTNKLSSTLNMVQKAEEQQQQQNDENNNNDDEQIIKLTPSQEQRKKWSLYYEINPKPFEEIYQIGEKIHSGTFAVVYKCRHKYTNEKLAVKCIPRKTQLDEVEVGGCNSNSRGNNYSKHTHPNFIKMMMMDSDENVLHEVGIMNSLDHPNIVSVVDFFETPKYYYIVMEYMAGGDVFDRIMTQKLYTEKDARDLIVLLLRGVQHMHERGIAHRDLKPQNILLESTDDHATIKIADMGFSRRVHTPRSLTSRCGTPSYVAPEILKNIPHDQSCDMWSVGVILYVLLCGYTPFLEETQERMFDRIKQGDVRFEPSKDWDHVSYEAKELIRQLLVVEPAGRLTAAEALRSKWILRDDAWLSSRDLSQSALITMKEKRPRLQKLAKAVIALGRISLNSPLATPKGSIQDMSEFSAELLVKEEDNVKTVIESHELL